jgi:anti-anti-sigma factor
MDEEPQAVRYFRIETRDDVCVVHFEDIQLGPDSRDAVYGLVDNQGHTKIVLDLSNIWALSSFALGILANLQKRAELAGGGLKLCGLNDNIKQLFRLTKFDQIFEIYITREEALSAF